MNTGTGQLYGPKEMQAAMEQMLTPEHMQEAGFDRAAIEKARAAIDLRELVDRGQVVPVSDEVVQKVRLGERELRRRRNRQARAARKRNR